MPFRSPGRCSHDPGEWSWGNDNDLNSQLLILAHGKKNFNFSRFFPHSSSLHTFLIQDLLNGLTGEWNSSSCDIAKFYSTLGRCRRLLFRLRGSKIDTCQKIIFQLAQTSLKLLGGQVWGRERYKNVTVNSVLEIGLIKKPFCFLLLFFCLLFRCDYASL